MDEKATRNGRVNAIEKAALRWGLSVPAREEGHHPQSEHYSQPPPPEAQRWLRREQDRLEALRQEAARTRPRGKLRQAYMGGRSRLWQWFKRACGYRD
jgi:hypothetical protein